MKAYGLDLRERVVNFVRSGGTKAEAARNFALGRRTVYRYLEAEVQGTLTPKRSWGRWRKLDPEKLQAHLEKHPEATLQKLSRKFAVTTQAVWLRLRQLGFIMKKGRIRPRTLRGPRTMVPQR